MNFAIVCPSEYSSGGPEALHQLAHQINIYEQHKAFICYYPFIDNGYKNDNYSEYLAPSVSRREIDESWVVVLPEVYPQLASEFGGSFICLWWLSADYGPVTGDESIHLIDLHIAQSEYGAKRAISNFGVQPLAVSDFINPIFCTEFSCQKEAVVAVNPTKGSILIDQFEMDNPDIPLVRLESMTRLEVSKALEPCGIYIDFGAHPGKDRIPREAAMRKCVVFVKNSGAAIFDEDVPIGDFYKFNSVDEVSAKVKKVIEDGIYEHANKQRDYRHSIEKERDAFARQVADFIKFVCINK